MYKVNFREQLTSAHLYKIFKNVSVAESFIQTLGARFISMEIVDEQDMQLSAD